MSTDRLVNRLRSWGGRYDLGGSRFVSGHFCAVRQGINAGGLFSNLSPKREASQRPYFSYFPDMLDRFFYGILQDSRYPWKTGLHGPNSLWWLKSTSPMR
jgi:hypothetical protein